MRRLTAGHPVLTAAEMRAREEAIFRTGEADSRVVLESAGRAVAHAVMRDFPGEKVIGVAGRGKNGSDTIVALRTLAAWGRDVVLVLAPGAAIGPGLSHGWSVPIGTLEEGDRSPRVLLDGLLGTGATGAPRAEIAALIEQINASGAPVVAVDGPSGIDLTTGVAAGAAVRADLTITFDSLKRGLLLHPGRGFAGTIRVAEIGLPPAPELSGAQLLGDEWARARLPGSPADAYKGSIGLVGVVAGGEHFGGAPILCAMGALRAGSGGVRILSGGVNRIAIQAAIPEAVFLAREDPGALDSSLELAALVVGPGLGLDEAAAHLLTAILERYPGPIALDADALTLLSTGQVDLPSAVARRCVLTPHPGELARLLGSTTAEVLDDRFASAHGAAERFGCAVLAKGAPSLVAAPGAPILIGNAGSSGVATAGMGDTLAGVVGACLARGVAPREAAALGLHLAGRAAERAGRIRGLLPRDVAEALPEALEALTHRTGGIFEPPFLLELPAAR